MGKHEGQDRSTNREYKGQHRVTSTTDSNGVRTDKDAQGRTMGWSVGRGADGNPPEDNYSR